MIRSRVWITGSLIIALVALVARADSGGDANHLELSPTGTGDDTQLLQTALSKCTNADAPCKLRLGKGVFYTDVLLVKGFHGSIIGEGQGRTIIKPLAHRALRSTRMPFFDEPTRAEPYPALIHFADGGKIRISHLTMDFPADMTVSPYDWYLLPPSDGVGIKDALIAAILVEGVRNAELVMTKVTIKGVDKQNYWGSNVSNAVRFEGKLRFSGDTDLTQKLESGRFVAYSNRFVRTGNGFWLEDTNNTKGTIFRNDIDTRIYGVIATNQGSSNIRVVHNDIRSELDGVLLAQTPERPPETASYYLIAKNKISVNENGLSIIGGANDGIALYDFAAEAGQTETILHDVDIWDNDITGGVNVLDGIIIFSDGPGHVRVLNNRIRGSFVEAGIWVQFSRGTVIKDNELGEINPPIADVALRDTARNCRVIEPGDTVQDDGTNNQVIN